MWFYILAIVVGMIGVAYLRIRKSYSYFRTHGVAEDPGTVDVMSKVRCQVFKQGMGSMSNQPLTTGADENSFPMYTIWQFVP